MSPRIEIREFIVDNFFVDAFGDEDSFVRTGIIDSMGILELVGILGGAFRNKGAGYGAGGGESGLSCARHVLCRA
jgi:hypothetical protein